MEMMPAGTLLLAGKASDILRTMARDANIKLIDYYDAEEVQIKNAVPTAEGAIGIAMRELPITLYGSHCTILGYGRIGQRLSDMLRALGAHVTVVARSESALCRAETTGCTVQHIDDFSSAPGNPDILFNTIPAPVLTVETLRALPHRTRIIELASAPGCMNADALKECRQKVIRAPSLPGRVAPYSAGKILYETIVKILQNEGVTAQ